MSKCAYCRNTFSKWHGRRRTRDHVLPRSRFVIQAPQHLHGVLNCVPCCERCNRMKADRTPWEWIDWLVRNDRRDLALEVSLFLRRWTVPPHHPPAWQGEPPRGMLQPAAEAAAQESPP